MIGSCSQIESCDQSHDAIGLVARDMGVVAQGLNPVGQTDCRLANNDAKCFLSSVPVAGAVTSLHSHLACLLMLLMTSRGLPASLISHLQSLRQPSSTVACSTAQIEAAVGSNCSKLPSPKA